MQRSGTRAILARAGWVLAAVLATSGPVIGQAEPQPGPAAADRGRPRGYEAVEGPVITINFPGGPLAQFVEALRRAAPDQPVNITYQQQAANVSVPPLQLREVALFTALKTLEWVATPGENRVLVVTDVRQSRSGQQGNVVFTSAPAFSIAILDQGARSPSSGPDRVTQSTSLRELIGSGPEGGGLPPEVILSAIEGVLALEEAERGDAAQIKFHKDSGLLLMRGNVQQIRAVEEAVGRLFTSVKRERTALLTERAERARRGVDLERAKIMVEQAESELKLAESRLGRTRELAKSGSVPADQLESAEYELAEAQRGLRMARAEADAAAIGAEAAAAGIPNNQDLDRIKTLEAENQALQREIMTLRKRLDDMEKRGEKDAGKR